LIFKRFFEFVKQRPFLFSYSLILTLAGAMFFRFVPVFGMVSGVVELSGTGYLGSLVALAEFVSAPDTRAATVMVLIATAFAIALLCALLFSGAIGSFARGMEQVGGFPAMQGMGFWGGYLRRFGPFLILFFVSFSAMLMLAFVWLVAVAPLAVVNEMAGQGALSPAVRNTVLVVTAFTVYVGFLLVRVFFLSLIPALCSDERHQILAGFAHGARHFFTMARFFWVADMFQILLFVVYNISGKSTALFYANSIVASFSVPFLVFVPFHYFALGGARGGEAAWDGPYEQPEGEGGGWTEVGGGGFAGDYNGWNETEDDAYEDDGAYDYDRDGAYDYDYDGSYDVDYGDADETYDAGEAYGADETGDASEADGAGGADDVGGFGVAAKGARAKNDGGEGDLDSGWQRV